jgi:hypothetical protein
VPIFMKNGEIHVGAPAERPEGAEAGEGTVLALHEAEREFEHAPAHGLASPEGQSD